MVSRPSRARGLKRHSAQQLARQLVSRPSRARGLKLSFLFMNHHGEQVAPLAGAWIETSNMAPMTRMAACRAPRGRVD